MNTASKFLLGAGDTPCEIPAFTAGLIVSLRIHSSALRYFDAVRRAQSIREAARQLNVASSAVNRQIIKLEEEIGHPLFNRLPTGLVLTAVGEALARHVITVFQDLERTSVEIDDIHGSRVGHITVAVGGERRFLDPSRGDRPGPGAGAAHHLHRLGHGLVRYSSRDHSRPGRCRRGLRAAEILGAATGFPGAVQARRDRAAGPPAGAQQDRDPAVLPRLSDDPGDTRHVDHQPAGAPVFPRDPPSFPRSSPRGSIELMQDLVIRGHGIAFQTRIGLDRKLSDGELVFIPIDAPGPLWSDLGIYTRSGRLLPTATDHFVQTLMAEIRRREPIENNVPS